MRISLLNFTENPSSSRSIVSFQRLKLNRLKKESLPFIRCGNFGPKYRERININSLKKNSKIRENTSSPAHFSTKAINQDNITYLRK